MNDPPLETAKEAGLFLGLQVKTTKLAQQPVGERDCADPSTFHTFDEHSRTMTYPLPDRFIERGVSDVDHRNKQEASRQSPMLEPMNRGAYSQGALFSELQLFAAA